MPTPLKRPPGDEPRDGSWRARLRRQVERWLVSPRFDPLSRRIARRYAGRSTSLMYHRVVAGLPEPRQPRCSAFRPNLCLSVSAVRFDEQMHELSRHFRPIDLPQALRELHAHRGHPHSVTVTFDDGYRDNLSVALPVLERHGVPATIFVTTGLIDRTAPMWWEETEWLVGLRDRIAFDWQGRHHAFELDSVAARWQAFAALAALFRPLEAAAQHRLLDVLRTQTGLQFDYRDQILDWDELRELDRHPLITIAAHSVNHPVLRALDRDGAAREIGQSRQRLEQQLGHPVRYFAYPYGGPAEAGAREFALCAEQGFAGAVTTRNGHWHAEHARRSCALPRVMIGHHDRLDDFRFKLSGLDAFLHQRGRRLAVV